MKLSLQPIFTQLKNIHLYGRHLVCEYARNLEDENEGYDGDGIFSGNLSSNSNIIHKSNNNNNNENNNTTSLASLREKARKDMKAIVLSNNSNNNNNSAGNNKKRKMIMEDNLNGNNNDVDITNNLNTVYEKNSKQHKYSYDN